MTMRTTLFLLLAAGLAAGCTARDFFGNRDDAPLHAINRPEGYPSSAFGTEMAPTFLHAGDEFADLVAVSAGRSTPTVFYKLSSNGSLVDVDSPWDDYATGDEAESSGSGAALAGLPTWAVREDGALSLITGCVAIGEPDAATVHVSCMQGDLGMDIPADATGEGEADAVGFGGELAAIRPTTGATWLLAAASERFVAVFSADTAADASAPMYPTYGGEEDYPIAELAAGALADGRFFVAAATGDEGGGVPPRVHVFLEDAPSSPGAGEVACVARDEVGFGGVMATGDLDRDGDDELIVSAAAGEGRVDAVYVYRISDLVDAAPTCDGATPDPVAVIEPGGGPLDVDCPPDAGCHFGAALAVGDLATDDGGPELIVGAPGAKVDGTGGAGAVYVFRGASIASDGMAPVAGQVADSAPEENERFGGGVAAAPMAGRAELLVGAVGKGKVFIAYCTGVGEDIEEGADVTRNATGKVVSTRCRPR